MRLRPAAALVMLAACTPLSSSYLEVPVVPRDGKARAPGLVRVPLRELRSRMPGFDPDRVAFYAEGREPLPHQLVDEDADQRPDAAHVQLRVAGDGSTRLVVVCPGPAAPAATLAGTVDRDLEVRFAQASR